MKTVSQGQLGENPTPEDQTPSVPEPPNLSSLSLDVNEGQRDKRAITNKHLEGMQIMHVFYIGMFVSQRSCLVIMAISNILLLPIENMLLYRIQADLILP